jgi:hypothetical protein
MKFVSVRNAVSPLNAAVVSSFYAVAVNRRWSDRSVGERERVKVVAIHVEPETRTGRYWFSSYSSVHEPCSPSGVKTLLGGAVTELLRRSFSKQHE